MPVSFTDIARLAPQIQDDETLTVGTSGKLSIEDKLDADLEGTALTEEELFAALERQTSKLFVDGLRGKLTKNTPLTGRVIRQVVADSKAEIETEAHLSNLTKGLVAKPAISCETKDFNPFLTALKGNAAVKALAEDPARNGAWLDCDRAAARVAVVRVGLQNVKTPEGVAALAAAEGDLAVALHAIGESVRLQVADLSDKNRLTLEDLDDYATEIELNAMRLGDVASVLPNDETSAAIKTFKSEARDFLAAVARLDTADPKSKEYAADLLAALKTSYPKAMSAFAVLKTVPGLDPRALRELEANLAEMKGRIDLVSESLQQPMKERALNEIFAMIRDGLDAARAKKEAREKHHDGRNAWSVPLVASLERISASLEKETAGKTTAERLAAVADEKSALSALFKEIIDFKLNTRYSNGPKYVGLASFEDRVNRLRALLGDERYASPISRLDVRLLGEVMRGETDLLNYIDLKEADIPEEVFLADLDGTKAHKIGEAGEGNFNSVSFYEIPSVQTGCVNKYVVKNIELSQDDGAEHGVASSFSRSSYARHTARINYASWKAANLIGCGSSITRSGVVRVDGRYQLVQEVAEGHDASVWRGKFLKEVDHPDDVKPSLYKEKFGGADIAVQRRIWRELHIAAAKLEWADWLSGQLDRTTKNELLDIQVEETKPGQRPHVTVTLKGIDNDAAFPERRTGLRNFKSPWGGEMLTSRDFPTDENAVKPAKVQLLMHKLDDVIYRNGVRSMRMPQFIPSSVRERLVHLTPEQYANEMRPLLSETALKAAVARYVEMREYALSLPPERVIYDSVNTYDLSDGEIATEMNRLDGHYGPHYTELKRQVADYIGHVGGFYGYVLHL